MVKNNDMNGLNLVLNNLIMEVMNVKYIRKIIVSVACAAALAAGSIGGVKYYELGQKYESVQKDVVLLQQDYQKQKGLLIKSAEESDKLHVSKQDLEKSLESLQLYTKQQETKLSESAKQYEAKLSESAEGYKKLQTENERLSNSLRECETYVEREQIKRTGRFPGIIIDSVPAPNPPFNFSPTLPKPINPIKPERYKPDIGRF